MLKIKKLLPRKKRVHYMESSLWYSTSNFDPFSVMCIKNKFIRLDFMYWVIFFIFYIIFCRIFLDQKFQEFLGNFLLFWAKIKFQIFFG